MERASRLHEPMVASRKRQLFGKLRGAVLEIGVGNGVNLQYLPEGLRWTGYEPNRVLAAKVKVPPNGTLIVDEYRGQAGHFDAVFCSLVLCSVADPVAVLRGVHESLSPGGRLVFLEHVAAGQGSALRRAQEWWLPLWKCCADGCHPNRETASLIAAAGFEMECIENFDLPLWLAGPHIAGIAVKPHADLLP
jgi:SAM-dependent methyltransferase